MCVCAYENLARETRVMCGIEKKKRLRDNMNKKKMKRRLRNSLLNIKYLYMYYREKLAEQI